jgi:hypothetical protein
VKRSIWVGIFGLAWLAGSLALYYASHKPFTPLMLIGVGRAAWQFLVAFVLVTLAGGIGSWCYPGKLCHPLERLALQAALGLGLISLGVLLVGTAGGFNLLLGCLALLSLLVLFRKPALGWLREWAALVSLWRSSGRLGRWIAVFSLMILGITLTVALAPPLQFDTQVYHLALPRLYLLQGRFSYVPQIMFWGMPQTGEMLYTWAMLLGGNQAAVVMGWLAGLLALVGLLGICVRRLCVDSSWVSIAAMLAGVSWSMTLYWGYIDWLAALFGVAFLIVLSQWLEQGQRSDLLFAGALAGMAMGVKYTAVILLFGGWAVILWHEWGRQRLGQMFLALMSLSILAGLFFLPWLLKNLIATGNPFYPLVFSAGAMTSLRLAVYQSGKAWGGWQDLFIFPFRVTYFGIADTPGYGASIGPLFLGLAPLAWLNWKNASAEYHRMVKLAVLVAAPGLLVWMVAERRFEYAMQARLYFIVFPALALLCAAGFEAFSKVELPGVRLGRVASAVVGLVMVFATLELAEVALKTSPFGYLTGAQTQDGYIADARGWYGPAMQAVRDLPDGSRVLMLWETRSLYCLPKCEPDEILDRWLVERYGTSLYARPRSTQAILDGWRAAGYTYLLYQHTGADFIFQEGRLPYQQADKQALDEMLASLPVVQNFGEAYTLYSLGP